MRNMFIPFKTVSIIVMIPSLTSRCVCISRHDSEMEEHMALEISIKL